MKRGSKLEQDVQVVYSYLLNMKDEGVIVGNNIIMSGKSGAQHEIDVYYEFEKAGIKHRVAIECKDWSEPVSKGKIQEFESKLRDIGNIVGVVISRNGYQAGADVFAKHSDISLLRFDDLPRLNVLMAERLSSVALPDENYVGEPFWIIMELQDGKVTGSHYGHLDPVTGKSVIPLTFCRAHAEKIMKDANLNPNKWAVRGLPKFALRAFLLTLELYEKRMNASAFICFLPPDAEVDSPLIAIPASQKNLARDYYGSPLPSIEESVMGQKKS